METRNLTLKETAKLLRVALKKNFPGVKFSVRSESFSMGSAIRVNYTDGPLQSDVESVVNCYAYGGFDGMIDLSFHVNHWMNEKTGEVVNASSGGTVNSGGMYDSYEYGCPGEGWVQVSFGAKYVTVSHYLSVEVLEEGLEMTAEKWDFDSNLVEVVYSGYGSWVKTDKLVEKYGWSNEIQHKVNEINKNAGLISAGEYHNG